MLALLNIPAKKIEQLLEQYKDYAEDNGFRLNPDQKIVEYLIKALLEKRKNTAKVIVLAITFCL